MEYDSILFKFRSCMEDIGAALRTALGTTKKYKFTEIADAINSCNQVLYLGTGTSFDLSGYVGYENFTAENFIIEPVSLSGSANAYVSPDPYIMEDNSTSASYSGNLSKQYNSSTGTLTCSLSASGSHEHTWGEHELTASGNAKVASFKAYLIKGSIR